MVWNDCYKIFDMTWQLCCLGNCRKKVTQNWVNISSGNGLLPEGTKPSPEHVLTSHWWGFERLPESNFIVSAKAILLYNEFANHTFKITAKSPKLISFYEWMLYLWFSDITAFYWKTGCLELSLMVRTNQYEMQWFDNDDRVTEL